MRIYKKLITGAMMTSVLIASASERKMLFNDNWQFYLTDSLTVDMPAGTIADSLWQDVRLPHDWSVTLPFDRNAAPGNDGGYLPAGTAWYRRAFNLKKLASDRRIELYFEGVYERSEVYVNIAVR